MPRSIAEARTTVAIFSLQFPFPNFIYGLLYLGAQSDFVLLMIQLPRGVKWKSSLSLAGEF